MILNDDVLLLRETDFNSVVFSDKQYLIRSVLIVTVNDNKLNENFYNKQGTETESLT